MEHRGSPLIDHTTIAMMRRQRKADRGLWQRYEDATARSSPIAVSDGASVRRFTGLLYVALTLGSAWVMVLALAHPISSFWAIAAIQTCGIAIVFAFEHALPYRPAWLRSHGDLRTDLAHLTITSSFVTGVRYLLSIAFVALIGPMGDLDTWPAAWPLAAQVGLAVLIQSFFGYWIHRAQHAHPILWRLHAVHHSAPRVYLINHARVHPIEALLDGLSIVPLILLGAPEPTLLVFTAFSAMHLMLQHANIDIRLGVFNWLVSLSEAHRWHHSRTRCETDTNFGGILLVWDVVFRTRFLPDREPPIDVGLEFEFPPGYFGQLAAPFRTTPGRKQ